MSVDEGCAKKESDFRVAARSLKSTMEELHKNIQTLGGVIDPVLKPKPPATTEKAACISQAKSEVESFIEEIRSLASHMNDTIGDYRSRICL